MRHVILTCKHHPNLRWSCKEIAFTDGYGYNGARHIFFGGQSTGKMHEDFSGVDCEIMVDGKIVAECKCPPTDLIRAPEDKDVHVYVRHDDKWTHVPQSEVA